MADFHRFCRWKSFTLGLITGLMSGVDGSSVQAQVTKPSVVATTSILCDVTRQIVQETIALTCLLQPGADPHLYSASPQDRKAIEGASLILYAGYNFEPNLIRLIQASPNQAVKVAVSEKAVPNPITAGHSHNHAGEHGHGHGSNAPDPHVFHSAENGAKMVQVIAQQLEALQPNQAKRYQANAKTLSNELSQIHVWIRSQIKTIPFKQRWLVTTHDAFEYYARTYNLGVAPTLQGISTDERPTAFRVAELVNEIKILGVPVIFAEATVNPRLINTVAREAKVNVSSRRLYADGLGTPGSEAATYPKMLIANTRTIVEGLGGKFTLFRP